MILYKIKENLGLTHFKKNLELEKNNKKNYNYFFHNCFLVYNLK